MFVAKVGMFQTRNASITKFVIFDFTPTSRPIFLCTDPHLEALNAGTRARLEFCIGKCQNDHVVGRK